MTLNEQYLVDVIGFNPVERSMLTSIFALAARRDPVAEAVGPRLEPAEVVDVGLLLRGVGAARMEGHGDLHAGVGRGLLHRGGAAEHDQVGE